MADDKTDERQGEPDSPNRNADLDTLNAEQLKSVAVALRQENERMRTHFDKELGEMQSSCEALSRTISEQSETLTNRAKVVEEVEHERDQLLQKIDDLTAVHEQVKSDALAAMQSGGPGEGAHLHLADALDAYAIQCARISDQDAHPAVVVTLIQMANHMRHLPNFAAVLGWLNGIAPPPR